MSKIQKIDIIPLVKIRKYDVDKEELQKCLRNAKDKNKITCKELAKILDIPITKVEHYFRTDDSFAIPDEQSWIKLKEILNITTDKFDKSILEFEFRDGIYEQSQRVYLTDGIAPTLTTSSFKILEKSREFLYFFY